jgi:hypothetical protein
MSLPFPLWFSAFLLSKGSTLSLPSETAPTTTIPSTLSTPTTATVAATLPSTSSSAMTNYLIPQQQQTSSTPIEIMDRKKKKPVMEKQRRDRMNKALEDLKVIIIRHDPNHTSKLEKADILEKTLELVRFFEFQITQIQQQTTAQTIGTIFDGLSRSKCSTEIIKSVRDVVISIFPPSPQQQLVRQQQHMIPTPSTAVPQMPSFNQHQLPRIPPTQPIHPLFFQAAMNPLLMQQRLPQQQHFIPNFNQTTPKASSAPVMTQPSSSSASSTTTTQIKSELSNSSPTKTYETETRSTSRAETENSSDAENDDNEDDDLIDVEKVDEHDETFSPPITPNKPCRKRSRNSSFSNGTSESAATTATEDDSGIFDGPSPPKKSATTKTMFSIDGILK